MFSTHLLSPKLPLILGFWPCLLPPPLLFLSSLTETCQPSINPLPSGILLLGPPALPEWSLGWTRPPSLWLHAISKAGFLRLSTQKSCQDSLPLPSLPQAHELQMVTCNSLGWRLQVQLWGGQGKVQAGTQTPSCLSPSSSCFSQRHFVHGARTLEGVERKGTSSPGSNLERVQGSAQLGSRAHLHNQRDGHHNRGPHQNHRVQMDKRDSSPKGEDIHVLGKGKES